MPFPVITEEPYTITLPPYGFLWFDLVPEERLEAGVSTERDRRPAHPGLEPGWGCAGSSRRSGVDDRARRGAARRDAPGLLDVVARVDGRLAHFVVGLRGVADEPHFLRSGEECALGLLDDEDGLAVCTDALRDAAAGAAAAGHGPRRGATDPGRWPCCATTTTPWCSTAATGATSWCSPGSTTGRGPTST